MKQPYPTPFTVASCLLPLASSGPSNLNYEQLINLSTLLRQVFWAFLCLKWKNSTFSRSMITISYNLKINKQLKLMLVAK
jgi:hypothetical protein